LRLQQAVEEIGVLAGTQPELKILLEFLTHESRRSIIR